MATVTHLNDQKERQSNRDHLSKLTEESRRVVAWISILRELEAYKSVKIIDAPELYTNISALQGKRRELIQHITQLEGLI